MCPRVAAMAWRRRGVAMTAPLPRGTASTPSPRPQQIHNTEARTVIVFALWRIFFGFSSGGLSMWRFE